MCFLHNVYIGIHHIPGVSRDIMTCTKEKVQLSVPQQIFLSN